MENNYSRVIIYVNIRLSFFRFSLSKDIFNHRDILSISIFNNNNIFWIMNVYSNSSHSAWRILKQIYVIFSLWLETLTFGIIIKTLYFLTICLLVMISILLLIHSILTCQCPLTKFQLDIRIILTTQIWSSTSCSYEVGHWNLTITQFIWNSVLYLTILSSLSVYPLWRSL